MYMWSSLTTVISDIALCCSVKIDKTNIDLICYFALLRVRIFALPQKKVQQRGVSKLYRRGLEIVYVILCRNLESVAAQRFQGFYRSKENWVSALFFAPKNTKIPPGAGKVEGDTLE